MSKNEIRDLAGAAVLVALILAAVLGYQAATQPLPILQQRDLTGAILCMVVAGAFFLARKQLQ